MSPAAPREHEAAVYDDFLGLDDLCLASVRLLVLTGCSGSGKTTALSHLVGVHPTFAGRGSTRIERHAVPGRGVPPLRQAIGDVAGRFEEVVAVDELVDPADLASIAALLRRGHVVLAASHLAPWWWLPFRALWPTHSVRTDRDPEKLARYLARQGLTYTEEAVAVFCRRYGANFTDCRIVLEWDGGSDFDRALARFLGCCAIERRRCA